MDGTRPLGPCRHPSITHSLTVFSLGNQIAMEIFSSSFGSEAGNVALKFLPFGGIFVTGGIAPKNIEWCGD
jgi:glucokinase